MQGLANRNMLWAHAIAEELARSGVGHACVCPGNRSGPLAFALAAQPLDVSSHIDERSAGFFALGLARAARAPVALLCTSGTAAANFLPAVVEAWHARAPLVVLTADRPPDLQDAGANQAIQQRGLYGAHVRWAFDLPLPQAEERALRHVRAVACRAAAQARGPPAGPVHLNVPFAKPLEPTPVPGDVPEGFAERFPLAARGRPDGAPFIQARAAPAGPTEAQLDALAPMLAEPRGLVVVGPQDDPALPAAVARLAGATGWPVLADPLSGLRWPRAAGALGAYDAFLASARVRAALAPRMVVRLGAAPTSDALLQFLEQAQAPQLVVDDDDRWRDPLHLPGARLRADPALACDALATRAAAKPDAAWGRTWAGVEQAAAKALRGALGPGFSEAHAALLALDLAPAGARVVVGNSLAIRDVDRFGAPGPKALALMGNRGASGIDGLTSTALGAAAAGGRTLLLTGDLAFLHDLPGLLAVKRLGLGAVLLVVNNDGGRIFDQLPAARHDPPYEELFATPHGLDLGHAARMVGASFARAESPKALAEELGRALAAPGAHVVEARVEAGPGRAARAAARDAAAQAAERALAEGHGA